MASAILRGANLNAFADTIATLVAQSPWERSAGTSIVKSGIGSLGSCPAVIAFPMASIINVLKFAVDCSTSFDMGG